MPNRSLVPCPRCGKATQGPCCRTTRQSVHHGLYGHKWKIARVQFLSLNPLCEDCQTEGRTTAATQVHHSQKHDGDEALFWRVELWLALCASCHSKLTNRGL